jgi:hypothetical protein
MYLFLKTIRGYFSGVDLHCFPPEKIVKKQMAIYARFCETIPETIPLVQASLSSMF